MNPLSPSRIRRICLAGVAALVVAAPAGARVMPVDEGDSSIVGQYGWGAAATYAKQQTSAALAASAANDLLAQYGWGAAATFAKQQTRAALAASAANDLLAQYGWGAAATYAKLHA
jgi:hypothetical protein